MTDPARDAERAPAAGAQEPVKAELSKALRALNELRPRMVSLAQLLPLSEALGHLRDALYAAPAPQVPEPSGVERERILIAAIRDIDAHATPFGVNPEDPDGNPRAYLVTVGAMHRALAAAGTAAKCTEPECATARFWRGWAANPGRTPVGCSTHLNTVYDFTEGGALPWDRRVGAFREQAREALRRLTELDVPAAAKITNALPAIRLLAGVDAATPRTKGA